MMNKTPLLLVLALTACGSANTPRADETSGAEHSSTSATTVEQAVATMRPTEGNAASGTVAFEQAGHSVTVTIDLGGLVPGTTHGFHVHETGDCSAPDGASAGGHFNPGGHDHALPATEARHAGDMGNVEADANGEVHVVRTFDNFSVGGGEMPAVLGRGVIVHASPDDGGQPTGNAGDRIACGVIE